MNKLIYISFLFSASFSLSQDTYNDSLADQRKEHKAALFDENQGILNSEDKEHLLKLDYFQVDTNFRIEAKWTKDKGRKFKMPTSTERLPVYRRYGYLTMTVNDTAIRLTVFQNIALKKKKEYKNYFFIPFRDETSGISSYGGGRYLDIYITKKENVILIDFNKCYNPYCAYSHRYSCPIPPEENTLDVQILAGEKTPIYK